MNKSYLKRIAMVCVGVFLMGFAISLSVYASLGTDPCTCMNLGVSAKLGISLGNWQLISNGIFLIFTLLFARHLIGFGTIVNMVAIGYLVDFFRGIFAQILPSQPSVLIRIPIMLFSIVLLSFTAALYMYPKLGVSPYDSISFILTERTHIHFRWCRIFCDVLSVLIGYLCGSIVGVGTVITAFCLGPLINYFIGLIARKFPLQFD